MSEFDSSKRFDMGRVVKRAFDVLGSNLPVFGGLALLLVALPDAVWGWIKPTTNAGGLDFLEVIGGAIVVGILALTAQAAMIHFAVSNFRDKEASFGESISTGFLHVWPLFLLSICVNFMVGIASFALLVPGFMLLTRWSAAIPAQVVENKGVFESMGRSADLTKGRRWSIFGLMIVYLLAIVVIQMIIAVVIGGSVNNMMQALSGQVFARFVTPVIGSAVALINGAAIASLYHELRSTREGGGEDSTVAVFD
jgi:hypothetical protein